MGLLQKRGLTSQDPTPKETNKVQGDMATTSSKTCGSSASNGPSMNSNIHGLVSHVIDSVHQAEVEIDKFEMTTLDTVTKGKKSSTEKAQWTEI